MAARFESGQLVLCGEGMSIRVNLIFANDIIWFWTDASELFQRVANLQRTDKVKEGKMITNSYLQWPSKLDHEGK